MSRLNKKQKEQVQQFMGITDTTERSATAALKASDWNLELAFEIYYSGGLSAQAQYTSSARPSTDASRMEKLFQTYKDPDDDMILVDGISKLCSDLEVDPSDIVMLLLSHKMHAATMCEYSKQEFFSGLRALRVDTVEGLRNALPALRAEINDNNKLRDVYYFAFGWSTEKGQKSLALDTALGMWRLIFSHSKWPLTEHWCQFLEEPSGTLTEHSCQFLELKHKKAISRDTWNQLWDFTKIPDLTFTSYDSEGAWPYLMDEFVAYLRELGVVPKLEAPSAQ